jgi:hypothetical protein
MSSHRWLGVFRLLLAATAATCFGSCFTPTYSDCAFRCATVAPLCPAEYECRSDGYCHLPDSTAQCAAVGAADLSMNTPQDLSVLDQ